jgi:hypothetical protein
VAAAVRARWGVFLAVAAGIFTLQPLIPPVVLSLVRKPWDYFAFNPWLSKLPGYLLSTDVPLEKKLGFLPNLALFWVTASGPYGSVEWGFAVDVTDLGRFVLTSLLVGAFFALWSYRRDRLSHRGWEARVSRSGGMMGVVASVFGLSTGPCSVTGCGAPVLPVLGLAFAGLSSGTIKFLSDVSKISAIVVMVGLALGVLYMGWIVGTDSPADPQPD